MADTTLTPIEIGLTAAIVAVEDGEPAILVAGEDKKSEPRAGLPFGPFDPLAHRTFEIGLRAWDRAAPLVVHCYAGISRSTAGAFVTACALNPRRDENTIARALRDASPTAMPNIRIVSLADAMLGRDGRMIAAIRAIGPGTAAYASEPFRLDLE